MEPDADPEARIRDLERPLADRAGELGTSPYPTPYPSPPSYSPYYAPPQQVVHKNSYGTAWLVPLAVGVVLVTAAIGAVVYFTAGSPGLPTPAPGIAGGGGPIDAPQPPTLPDLPALESSGQVVTVGPGAVTNLAGVETHRTVRCDGGTVSVSGVSNVVEVLGPCSAVIVSGVENILTVDEAQTIRASGFDNRVTYRSGTPEVSTSGGGNVVEQG